MVELEGVRLAITICEDAWNDKNFWPRRLYTVDPVEELMRQQPGVHINLSSSPFWHGKRAIRRGMLEAIARRDGIPVLMCNQVGGNDSLIFDGTSLALNARGELIAQAASFAEDLVVVDAFGAATAAGAEDDDTAAAYQALVLGTRDYVRKCGFRKVLVGLSGAWTRRWWRPLPRRRWERRTCWGSGCRVRTRRRARSGQPAADGPSRHPL